VSAIKTWTTAQYRDYLKTGALPGAKAKRPRISKLCFGVSPTGVRREGETLIMTFPLPPTKNSEPRNRYEVHRMRKHWAGLTQALWLEAGRPKYDRIVIKPVWYLSKINRDYDNLFGQAFKGIQDGFKGTMVLDDSSKYVDLDAAVMTNGTPRLELWITEVSSMESVRGTKK